MITNIYLKLLISYGLCLFYSGLCVLRIAYLFATKYSSKFWEVKDRPVPPKALQSKEFGEHKFVTANGIKIHYVEKGDNTKPLMLFVHGFPEFWYSWRFQLQEFSKDYWTVALDMRGYGDTSKPPNRSDYKIDNLADDIKGLVDALGRDKFTLVAHDWGAVVAFHYIQQYNDTVEKYVCIGGPPSAAWNKLVFSQLDQFKKSWYIFFFQIPFLPEFNIRLFDLAALKVIGAGAHTEFTAEDLEAYKYTFSKPGDLTGPINYYRNIGIKPRSPKKWNKPAPGLFLVGDGDKFISKAAQMEAQNILKNLEIGTIPEANHFAQQDNPTETNKLIRKFLIK